MSPTGPASSDDLIARVRAALARIPGVDEKRMFGGTTFMVRGNLCVSARPERIMCRIDPRAHDRVVGRRDAQPVVTNGRRYRGYVRVEREALRTKRALEYWIALALDCNGKAKTSKRRRGS